MAHFSWSRQEASIARFRFDPQPTYSPRAELHGMRRLKAFHLWQNSNEKISRVDAELRLFPHLHLRPDAVRLWNRPPGRTAVVLCHCRGRIGDRCAGPPRSPVAITCSRRCIRASRNQESADHIELRSRVRFDKGARKTAGYLYCDCDDSSSRQHHFVLPPGRAREPEAREIQCPVRMEPRGWRATGYDRSCTLVQESARFLPSM